jgi:hypothetical protein
MEAFVPIVAIVMVFSIPLSVIIGGYYYKLQKMKMEQGGSEDSSDLRKQVGNLLAENEDIKERLKNLEYIISDEGKRIDLDYEKEQIRIDEQNKFKY